MSKVLVISPHTDDAELGCGGTISKIIRNGDEVFCLVLSKAMATGESRIPKKADDTVFNELRASMKELGIPDERVFTFQFPTRYLYSMRQDILDRIIEVRKEIEPDIIFLPNTQDFHQDHMVVSKEGIRAFKNKTIYGYEYPWNNLSSTVNCLSVLDKQDIQTKLKAIGKYKSQRERPYMKKDFILSWARLNGIRIGVEYAEGFELIRGII